MFIISYIYSFCQLPAYLKSKKQDSIAIYTYKTWELKTHLTLKKHAIVKHIAFYANA